MNEHSLNVLTNEIKASSVETGQLLIKYGKTVLGEKATIGQITKVAGSVFGLEPSDCLQLIKIAAFSGGNRE